MTTHVHAFILALRGVGLSSKFRAIELSGLVGPITTVEQTKVNLWLQYASQINPDPHYTAYETTELKSLLELKTGHSLPMPLGLLGGKTKQRLLAYYLIRGYEVVFPAKEWTEEQEALFTDKEGIHVVNSGPGCGKTTVANERAHRYRNEGVLLMSYTNEAINENFKRLHEYPQIRGLLGKKDWNRRLNVATADSLAQRVLGAVPFGDRHESGSHDVLIRAAIDRLQNDPEVFTAFMMPGQGPLYRHVIVDECQDIDDIRGELILTFYRMMRCRSLLLMGDPRQRIREQAGGWYSGLWEGSYQLPPLPDRPIPRIFQHGLSFSYRFHNPALLTLTNLLSQRRPHYHHELIQHASLPTATADAAESPIDFIKLTEGCEDADLALLAKRVKALPTSFNQIAVVGPSLERQNQTSALGQRIYTAFREAEIPCYTRSDGAYQPNGVLFTTVQAVKGKEFDYVILFGVNNYPASFSMIPHAEGESLVFVMHTRARRKMFYVALGSHFQAPRGIPATAITNLALSGSRLQRMNRERETPPQSFNTAAISMEFGLPRLLQANGYIIAPTSSRIMKALPRPPHCHAGAWEHFIGLVVLSRWSGQLPRTLVDLAMGSYETVSFRQYETWRRQGVLVNGIHLPTNRVVLTQHYDTTDLAKVVSMPCEQLDPNQWLCVAKAHATVLGLAWIHVGFTEIDVEAVVTALQERLGSVVLSEVLTTGLGLVGCVDIVTATHAIQLKDTPASRLQAWLHHLLHPHLIPAVVNLMTGEVTELASPQSLIRWQYIMAAFIEIKTHVELVQTRLSTMIERGLQPPVFPANTFTVDTEFSTDSGQRDAIFDLAVVNVTDPFRSLVQTINVEPGHLPFASSWIHQPVELFTTSPSLAEVQELFYQMCRLHAGSPACLNYYMCPVDVSWAPGIAGNNLGGAVRQKALQHGHFISGTQPPKLTDFYGLMATPLEFRPHLRPHTALSDALMLYELMVIGTI